VWPCAARVDPTPYFGWQVGRSPSEPGGVKGGAVQTTSKESRSPQLSRALPPPTRTCVSVIVEITVREEVRWECRPGHLPRSMRGDRAGAMHASGSGMIHTSVERADHIWASTCVNRATRSPCSRCKCGIRARSSAPVDATRREETRQRTDHRTPRSLQATQPPSQPASRSSIMIYGRVTTCRCSTKYRCRY